jgi:hypothetical protein
MVYIDPLEREILKEKPTVIDRISSFAIPQGYSYLSVIDAAMNGPGVSATLVLAENDTKLS